MTQETEVIDQGLRELIAADRILAIDEDPPVNRMRARLLLSIGVAGATATVTGVAAAAGASAATEVAKAAAKTGAAAALKTKVITVVAIATVSAGSGAAVQKYRDERRYAERSVTLPAPAPPMTSTVEPIVAAAPVVATPPARAPRDASSGRDAELQAERRLIEAARTALLRREPQHAMESLAAHEKRFAKGQLEEERNSLRVQALSAMGKAAEARAAAKAFLARYPHSFFTGVVTRTLTVE